MIAQLRRRRSLALLLVITTTSLTLTACGGATSAAVGDPPGTSGGRITTKVASGDRGTRLATLAGTDEDATAITLDVPVGARMLVLQSEGHDTIGFAGGRLSAALVAPSGDEPIVTLTNGSPDLSRLAPSPDLTVLAEQFDAEIDAVVGTGRSNEVTEEEALAAAAELANRPLSPQVQARFDEVWQALPVNSGQLAVAERQQLAEPPGGLVVLKPEPGPWTVRVAASGAVAPFEVQVLVVPEQGFDLDELGQLLGELGIHDGRGLWRGPVPYVFGLLRIYLAYHDYRGLLVAMLTCAPMAFLAYSVVWLVKNVGQDYAMNWLERQLRSRDVAVLPYDAPRAGNLLRQPQLA